MGMDDTSARAIAFSFPHDRSGIGGACGALSPTSSVAALYLTAGRAMLAQHRNASAALCARCALSHAPAMEQAHRLLGEAQAALHRPHAALQNLRTATALAPHNADIYRVIGQTLSVVGEMDAALATLRLSARIRPDDTHVWIEAGQVYRRAGQPGLAAACFATAHRLDSNRGDALVHLGLVLHGAWEFAGAVACFRMALTIDPFHAPAMRALAEVAGEPRWSGRTTPTPPVVMPAIPPAPAVPLTPGGRRLAVPEWAGQPLTGRSLFLWTGGDGEDIAMACRYPDLIRAAGSVTIECGRRHLSLFARSFPRAVIRPRQPDTRTIPWEVVNCDLHASSDTLLRCLPAFPPRSSWLYADDRRIADWNGRLDEVGGGRLRVGVAWHGVPGAAPERWGGAVLLADGLTLVSLQPNGDDGAIAAAERRFGVPIHRWRGLDLMEDMEQTAALIGALDMVIAPPGPVADLAGALGVPAWCLDPDPAGEGHRGRLPARHPPTHRRFTAHTAAHTRAALVRIGQDLRRLTKNR